MLTRKSDDPHVTGSCYIELVDRNCLVRGYLIAVASDIAQRGRFSPFPFVFNNVNILYFTNDVSAKSSIHIDFIASCVLRSDSSLICWESQKSFVSAVFQVNQRVFDKEMLV